MSFLSFQPVFHKGRGMYCLWDGTYKRTLAADMYVAHVVAAAGFLSHCLNGYIPYARRHITVNKMC